MAARLAGRTNAEDCFAQIATEVLTEVAAPRIDVLGLGDWALRQKALPKQVNLHTGFGQPPLVVYQEERFFLEVLVWFPSRTGIHGHGFSGAFRILDGYSIQAEYEFQEESAPEEGIRLGILKPRSIALMVPEKVCSILPGADFVHTVVHMGNPSLTLVARTYGQKGSQFAFHRCGFACRSNWEMETITRQAQVLEAVLTARPDAFAGRLADFLQNADGYHFFSVLDRLRQNVALSVFSKNVLPLMDAESSKTRQAAVAALQEGVRSAGLWSMIRSIPDPAKQFQLALSELFPDTEERDALLRQTGGNGDAAKVITEWQRQVLCSLPAQS